MKRFYQKMWDMASENVSAEERWKHSLEDTVIDESRSNAVERF